MENLNQYNPAVIWIFLVLGAVLSFSSVLMPRSGQGRTPKNPNDYEQE